MEITINNEKSLKNIPCLKPDHLNKPLEFVCTSPECLERFYCSVCLLKEHAHHFSKMNLIDFVLSEKKEDLKLYFPVYASHEKLITHLLDKEQEIKSEFKNTLENERKSLEQKLVNFKKEISNSINKCKKEINETCKLKIDAFKNSLSLLINFEEKPKSKKVPKKIQVINIKTMNDVEGLFEREKKDSLFENDFNETDEQNIRRSFFELRILKNQQNKFDKKSFNEIKVMLESNQNLLKFNRENYQIQANQIYRRGIYDFHTDFSSVQNSENQTNIITDHSKPITSILLHEEENLIFTASQDCTIKIWELDKFVFKTVLSGHNSLINKMILLGENKLVSAGSDQKIRIWNYKNGVNILTLSGHTNFITSLVELTQTTFVSGSLDRSIRFWDVNSPKSKCIIKNEKQGRCCALLIIENDKLICGSDNKILIYDISEHSSCVKIGSLAGHSGLVKDLLYLEKEKKLFSCSEDKDIILWDMETNKCSYFFKGHTCNITKIFSYQRNVIISFSQDDGLKFWDIDEKKLIKELKLETNDINVLNDGRLIFSGGEHSICKNHFTINFLII